MIKCTMCRGRGIREWLTREAELCDACDGEGELTAEALDQYLKGLVDHAACLPGSDVDDSMAALERFREDHQDSGHDSEEMMARWLQERGIDAKPRIKREHLLPEEGGEMSPARRQHEEALREAQQLKERYGPDLYPLYASGRISREEAEETAALRSR